MSNRILLTIYFIVIYFCSFAQQKPRTYVILHNPELTIRYMSDGLLCSGMHKNKYKIYFTPRGKLSSEAMVRIETFIANNQIWYMGESYRQMALCAAWVEFTLVSEKENEYKTILYSNCYNSTLDSLMLYVNELIPDKKRKIFNVIPYRFPVNIGNCQ